MRRALLFLAAILIASQSWAQWGPCAPWTCSSTAVRTNKAIQTPILRVLEGGASPTYFSIFQGGDQAADLTYTLPTAIAAGSLTTTAGGVLSWTPAASSGFVLLQGATPGTAQTGHANLSGTVKAGTLQAGWNHWTGASAGTWQAGTATAWESIAGSNLTLSALATPVITSVTPQTAGGGKTWTYVVQAILADGTHSTASAAVSTADGANDLTAASSGNTILWGAVNGATLYDVYRTACGGTTPATTGYIGSVTAPVVTLLDNGLAGGGGAVPTGNSTGVLQAEKAIINTPLAQAYGGTGIGTSGTLGQIFTQGATTGAWASSISPTYVEFRKQGAAPAGPTDGFRLYAEAVSGRLAWIRNDGFQRIMDFGTPSGDVTTSFPAFTAGLTALQSTSPGTKQVGNLNISATGAFGQATTSGLELLVAADGTFTGAATGWTLGSFTYGTNAVSHVNGGGTGALTPTVAVPVIIGHTYRMGQTVSGYSAGTVTGSVGGVAGTARSANGVYASFPLATATTNLTITPTDTLVATVDDVSLVDLDTTVLSTGKTATALVTAERSPAIVLHDSAWDSDDARADTFDWRIYSIPSSGSTTSSSWRISSQKTAAGVVGVEAAEITIVTSGSINLARNTVVTGYVSSNSQFFGTITTPGTTGYAWKQTYATGGDAPAGSDVLVLSTTGVATARKSLVADTAAPVAGVYSAGQGVTVLGAHTIVNAGSAAISIGDHLIVSTACDGCAMAGTESSDLYRLGIALSAKSAQTARSYSSHTTASPGVVTLDSAHGWSANQRVVLMGGTWGGLTQGLAYYVVSPSGATCQLSLTSGGTGVAMTSAAATGSPTLEPTATVSVWIK